MRINIFVRQFGCDYGVLVKNPITPRTHFQFKGLQVYIKFIISGELVLKLETKASSSRHWSMEYNTFLLQWVCGSKLLPVVAIQLYHNIVHFHSHENMWLVRLFVNLGLLAFYVSFFGVPSLNKYMDNGVIIIKKEKMSSSITQPGIRYSWTLFPFRYLLIFF